MIIITDYVVYFGNRMKQYNTRDRAISYAKRQDKTHDNVEVYVEFSANGIIFDKELIWNGNEVSPETVLETEE